MSEHTVRQLSYKLVNGISEKTMSIHHDKLYAGYVNKRNEIEALLKQADRSKAAATFSDFRSLKAEETFNANGMILHEIFFEGISGQGGKPSGKLLAKIEQDFGSYEAWETDFRACGMSARGWAVLAFDPSDCKLHNYIGDAHNQGGVWGATPLLTLDVYEHAYMIDYGSDRKSYIEAFMKLINWNYAASRAEKLF